MIRLGNKYDIDTICNLLIDFHKKVDNNRSAQIQNWSKTYIVNQLTNVFAGAGFVLIDNNKQGFLCAVKNKCFWVDNTWVLQEVMWHSIDKKTGLKLIQEYIRIGKEMMANGTVSEVYFSSFGDANWAKMGAVKIANHWRVQ